MYEITELSISEIDSVGGGEVHCARENVLMCNADNSSCIWVQTLVCHPGPA